MGRSEQDGRGRWRRRGWMIVGVVLGLAVGPVAAFASHGFTDVPDSNIFHGDIDWLADAGVTKGCNPPSNTRFCPSNVVTRETMAAFLKRMATNRVVDAGTLEGKSAAELDSPIRSAFGDPDVMVSSSFKEVIRLSGIEPGPTVVIGKTNALWTHAGETECRLMTSQGDFDVALLQKTDTGTAQAPITLTVVTNFATTGSAWLECKSPSPGTSLSWSKVTAVSGTSLVNGAYGP